MYQLSTPPEVIKLLAHKLRWQLIQALVVGDYRVNELVKIVDHPANLVLYHLKQLRTNKLVSARHSEADGRDTYYSLDLPLLKSLYHQAGIAIHPSMGTPVEVKNMVQKPAVLFVCTHNSARSQIAEGLMRHLSENQLTVMSAGSSPTQIHPDVIVIMEQLGIDIRDQHSKSFDEVLDQSFDVVISVCDRAREVCPSFPAETIHLHWGYLDPLAIEDPKVRQQALTQIAQSIQSRIQHFLANPQMGDLN